MCSKEQYNGILELDENSDIYPCKHFKCNYFHKSINKYEALLDSIYYLKPPRVKELLEQFDDEEIKDDRLLCKLFTNILDSTIENICGTNGLGLGLKIPTIKNIGVYAFRNSSYGNISNQNIGAKLFLEIVELLCVRYPWMINKSCYLLPNTYSIIPLKKILDKFTCFNLNNKSCQKCNSSSQEHLIIKTCKCVDNYIHLECLIEQINKSGDICQICMSSSNSYICPRGRISFPKSNIYKQPLLSNYYFIPPENKFEQLRFACVYLIEPKVKELLDSFSTEEFVQYIGFADYCSTHTHYSDYPNIIVMNPNPFSNLSEKAYPKLFEKINALLINKCIECMDYSCESNIKISWGKYRWCGQSNSPTGSGFTLTNSNCTDIYGDPNTYAMLLELKLNQKLILNTTFLDIYDHKGSLIAYNIDPINKSEFAQFCKIKHELIGTELELIFSKTKKLTLEEKDKLLRIFGRTPREPIYSFKIKIPELIQYGDKSDCNICLGNVLETDKYITPCGHLFYLDCIFKYLESKNLLYPMYTPCAKLCCGAKKIKPFECVVCKSIITK